MHDLNNRNANYLTHSMTSQMYDAELCVNIFALHMQLCILSCLLTTLLAHHLCKNIC